MRRATATLRGRGVPVRECVCALCRDSCVACEVRIFLFRVWGSPSLFAIIFKHTVSPHPVATPKPQFTNTQNIHHITHTSRLSGLRDPVSNQKDSTEHLQSSIARRGSCNRPPPRARLDQVALPSRLSSPPRRAQHSHSYTRTHRPSPPLIRCAPLPPWWRYRRSRACTRRPRVLPRVGGPAWRPHAD